MDDRQRAAALQRAVRYHGQIATSQEKVDQARRARNAAIVEAYAHGQGTNIPDIAKALGLSSEMVSKILSRPRASAR